MLHRVRGTDCGLMVRDGAMAGVACVNLATKRLLTMRVCCEQTSTLDVVPALAGIHNHWALS